MSSVLADTGPLYALIDQDDQHHERAHQELAQLVSSRQTLSVATCTLVETHRLLLRRLGLRIAQRWFEQITRGAGVLSATTDDVLEAAARVHRYTDQEISLHDGVVGILALRLRLPVWTFDRHFDVMQVTVWR